MLSRIEREARKIAECTSYTLCVLLSFSSDWTKLGQQRYRQGSTTPAAPASAHSRQQISNVEAISGQTAVLPLNWAPTSREQLASQFIVPPPASQHNPYESAGSYSARFRAQHPKTLPKTLSPTARDRLASRFIVPPSAPQCISLAPPLSSCTYLRSEKDHRVHLLHCLRLTLFLRRIGRKRSQSVPLTLPASYSFSPEDREHGLDKARAAAVPPGLNNSRTCSHFSSFAPADHQR